MSDMGLSTGAGGGMAYKLFQDMLARRFKEQQAEQAQQNIVAQLGLDRRKVDENTRQFDTSSGFQERNLKLEEQAQPIRIGHMKAQTADLERKPADEQTGRDFTTKRDAALHGYQMSEIGATGANALRVANVRGASEPVVRIQTIDQDGNPIVKVLPRSQASGQDFAAAPTTDMRNRSASIGRSTNVIQAIAELSEKINTGRGLEAKAVGQAAKLAARGNLNDDVSEYEAVVSGFTPLLARAVGHTGVLTEQDVQSVRRMLPDPGDSKTVRDRKIARIQSLMGSMAGPGGAQPPAATAREFDFVPGKGLVPRSQ